MNMQTLRRPAALLLGCLTLMWNGLASAEPPSRAARLGYISGTVSFSPASQPDWVQAVVNRPLTTGDRLWADASSRAELQVGGAAIRLGADSSVTLLNLDDRIAQVKLSQGTLKIRVRHLAPEQSFEIDTPNLAFTIRRPGEYRIDVDPGDDATAVSVQNGEAEVYGEGASYAVTPRQGYRFYGAGLSDYDALPVRRDDDLDRWARDRDRRADSSPSARYVSQEVVGYEDLDANGSWRADPSYGSVWTPTRVAAGWTPYHDGHWAWVDPWGWTWVDDAPWGFAVSHYGRWANFNGTWGWVPGPPREQAVYAPALVAFVGGQNFQVSVSVGSAMAAVGWFPLAPREVYQPSYPVSRGYFDNINRSNAVIAPTTITNVYNTTNVTNTTIVNNTTNIVKTVYVNQQVSGAVVAVPAQAFAQSQSVARAAVPLSSEVALNAQVAPGATVAPVQQSVHGGAPLALAKPPARELAVVAHTPPPPPPVPFAEQQKHLAANPGKPIDEASRAQLKPTIVPGPEAKVSVIAAARAPVPTAPPPTTAPAPKTPEARKAEAARPEATAGGRPADEARSAAARADAAKAGAANADTAKIEAARAEAAKTEAMKTDAAKASAARTDAAKADAARVEAAKAEATRVDAAKADAARATAARDGAAKAESGRVEAAKADATRAAATRADLARTEAAKADTARTDAAKAEAAKAESARSAAAKADASRAEAAQAEAARANVAKAESAKGEAARAEAARGDAARAEANRAAAAKAEAGRAESAKPEAAKTAAARGDAARAEAARANVERAAQPKPMVAAPPSPRASSPRTGPDAKGDEEKK